MKARCGRIGVAGAALLAAFASPWASPAAAQPPSLDTLEVLGAFDYDWSVRTADGVERPMRDLRGEVLVVNVWATWCAPCVAELGSFERLGRALDNLDADVRLVFVSPEDPETVAAFAERHGFELDLVTEARRIPSSLGELVLPTTFVVDRRGRIVLRHRGASEWAQPGVVAFLRALADEGPPAASGDASGLATPPEGRSRQAPR